MTRKCYNVGMVFKEQLEEQMKVVPWMFAPKIKVLPWMFEAQVEEAFEEI